MSIQIIDGFRLNVATPVDERMVTSGTSSRNSILYKYEGLRVFDTVQKTAFVWIDNAWLRESETSVSSSGVIPGLTGTTNKVLKFITATKVGDSSIFDNGNFVGIGTSTPEAVPGAGAGVTFRLSVNGNAKATSFYGNGTNLTSINASSISTGTLAIARIANGNSNQVLASGTSAPQWIDISTLSAGTVTVTNDTSNASNHYISFTSVTTGSAALKVNSTGLIFNPSKGQILLGAGSAVNPAYSFTDNIDTGIYRIANEKSIGFSTSGTVKMVIKAAGEVEITNNAKMGSATITGAASMNSATITGAASMGSATITGAASMNSATITGAASMGSATISGAASMNSATIAGVATMNSATIAGVATMNSATIANNASMGTATVNGTATMTNATVTGVTSMYSVTIGGPFKITSGSPGANKVLTSNTTGDASWVAAATIPIGAIIMWSAVAIPDKWKVCDGNNGTPNLVDRFIIGAGSNGGGSGGSGSPTDAVTISTSITIASGNLPKHTHGKGTLANNSAGAHSHTIGWTIVDAENGSGEQVLDHYNPEPWEQTLYTNEAGAHTHTISGDTGDGGFANNAISISGSQGAKKYYKMVFIMYVG